MTNSTFSPFYIVFYPNIDVLCKISTNHGNLEKSRYTPLNKSSETIFFKYIVPIYTEKAVFITEKGLFLSKL